MKIIIKSIVSIIIISFTAMITLSELKNNDALAPDQYIENVPTEVVLPVYSSNSVSNATGFQQEGTNGTTILPAFKFNGALQSVQPAIEANASNYDVSYVNSFISDPDKRNNSFTSNSIGGIMTALYYGGRNSKKDEFSNATGLMPISRSNMNLLMNDFGEKAEYENKLTPPSNLINTPTEQLPIGNEVLPLVLFALFFIITRIYLRPDKKKY